MRVLRGVVYRMNSKNRALRYTIERTMWGRQGLPKQRTRKERDDKYDLNQFKTVP